MIVRVEELMRDAFPGFRKSSNECEFTVECPFHRDTGRKKHLYVNAKNGLFYCFRCEEKGSFPKLVKAVCEAHANLEFSNYVVFDGKDERPDMLVLPPAPLKKTVIPVPLPPGYLPVWKPTDRYETLRREAFEYLMSRGVDPVKAQLYEVGFAPAGCLGHRVIVPVRAITGRLVGWVARDITGTQSLKILSSDSEQESVKDHVFGLNHTVSLRADSVTVVEGVFDAMRHGVGSFVALLGKSPTAQQLAAILSLKLRQVVVLLDRDAPREAQVLARRMVMHVSDVRVATLTRSKDPGEAEDAEIHDVLAAARRIRA